MFAESIGYFTLLYLNVAVMKAPLLSDLCIIVNDILKSWYFVSFYICVKEKKKLYKILIFNHRPRGKWAFPFHIRIFYFQEEQRCQLSKGSKNKDSGQETEKTLESLDFQWILQR